MKYTFLYAFFYCVIFSAIQVQAQQGNLQGKWVLGGNVGYANFDNNHEQTISKASHRLFTFSPTIGFFTSNSWQVGIRSTFQNIYRESENSSSLQTNIHEQSIGLGGYMRHYNWLFDHFAFYLETNLSYSRDFSQTKLVNNSTTHESKSKGGTIALNVTPGFIWQINQRIGIDFTTRLFSIGYTYTRMRSFESQKLRKTQESFWANISNGKNLLKEIHLGLSVFI